MTRLQSKIVEACGLPARTALLQGKEVEDIEARDEPKKQTKTMSSMKSKINPNPNPNKTLGPMAIEEKQSITTDAPYGHHSRTALSEPLDRLVKSRLETQWHKVSPQTKQLVRTSPHSR